MKDYSKMSDFEINKAVATALGMDVSGATEENNIMYGYVDDYCNNPSDAWPIIMEYQISIVKYEGPEKWDAHGGGVCVDYDHCIISSSDCSYSNKNPLRAAMIVFLMMKDAAK